MLHGDLVKFTLSPSSKHVSHTASRLLTRKIHAALKNRCTAETRRAPRSLRDFIVGGSRRPNARTNSTSAVQQRIQEIPKEVINYIPEEEELEELVGKPRTLPDAAPRFDWRIRAVSRNRKYDAGKLRYVSRRVPKESSQNLVYLEQIESYKNYFKPLIEAEEGASQEVVLDRLRNWGLQKLLREGYCMSGLHAFWLNRMSLGRRVAGFRFSGGNLPPNIFKKGSQVLVSRLDPLKEGLKGSIAEITTEQVDITFDESLEDLDDGFWRLDLGHSNAVYERMREAILMLHAVPEKIEADPENKPGQVELILQGTQLRDDLLQSFGSAGPDNPALSPHHLQDPAERHYLTPSQLEHGSKLQLRDAGGGGGGGAFADNCLIRSWAERYRRPNPVVVEGDPDLSGLNASQVRAVATMVGERISLVQGPPGTGKTKTIVETVKLLKGTFEVPQPILVCTYTNTAVDNLLENIAAAGLKPLRVGYEGFVKAGLEEYMMEVQFDKHPRKAEYDAALKRKEKKVAELKDLTVQLKETKDELITAGPRKAASLAGRIKNMEGHLAVLSANKDKLSVREYVMKQRILRDIFMRADVICTTCVRSASYTMRVVDFPVVFLDEASMSTEPASLIPIMKGCRHLALIGDHKQLPPIVQSEEAKAGGLDISLFERLIREGNVPSVMLDTQYRMHPSISKFPSAEFYDLMLLDGTVCRSGQVLPALLPPSSAHLPADPTTGHRPSLVFIDHEGPEEIRSKSRVNYMEAYIVLSIVEDLLRQNQSLGGQDIGIIAAYKSQVNLITRLLTRDARSLLTERLGKHRASDLPNIEVKTVDGFEGRQKDAIIFSTVRNNSSGYIGFLADRRRLNVGLTRAKRALFVVGSMNTLKTGKYRRNASDNEFAESQQTVSTTNGGALAWRNYAQFLIEQNLVLKLSGPELVKTLDPYSKIYDRGMQDSL